ncbi:hypothetical protein GCG54_00013207 [Colletotrichum gloeosporioides]|uniref:Uncharacterized protein n=1 Tax=Colletotrichum gloeosporioides TaxID=474922 RepID=A0A8H4C792_COLGL|nr:uncharacterized protein GCG54_00013207 [Colletotrichum gloeosporioides]KAF3798466.1 hypothetical protein GCG54_00013207 [Colletotrichum gloeosporioides]
MLLTGNVIDRLDCTFGAVDATFCEVENPIAFVIAGSVGIAGDEPVDVVDSDRELKSGRCKEWENVDEQSPMLPMVVVVSKPTSSEGHVQPCLFLDSLCHPSMAGTGGVCTNAASRIKESVTLAEHEFVIQHPAGHLPLSVKTDDCEDCNGAPSFETLGFMRTARYIFQGDLFIPSDL